MALGRAVHLLPVPEHLAPLAIDVVGRVLVLDLGRSGRVFPQLEIHRSEWRLRCSSQGGSEEIRQGERMLFPLAALPRELIRVGWRPLYNRNRFGAVIRGRHAAAAHKTT